VKRYEVKFLDGPGDGKVIETDQVHKVIWLINTGRRYWTFTEPEHAPGHSTEAIYKLLGHAPRLDGRDLLVYGLDKSSPPRG
jgi:hypothetical protein